MTDGVWVTFLQESLLHLALTRPGSAQSSSLLRPDEGGRCHQAVCGPDPAESGRKGPQADL